MARFVKHATLLESSNTQVNVIEEPDNSQSAEPLLIKTKSYWCEEEVNKLKNCKQIIDDSKETARFMVAIRKSKCIPMHRFKCCSKLVSNEFFKIYF